MPATYSIPPEYQHRLKPVDITTLDKRTNNEILQSLAQHSPITSEKNLWAFWDSGLNSMPAWCQRNVVDWVRICAPLGWTIRVLDNVPSSPNYALNFVSRELLPDAFVERKMDGPYIGPHSADFLRGALLYQHGGAYMDVGCILIRDMDRICWNEIADPASPINVVVPLLYGQHIGNYFVAAKKGDPFIKRWHDLFTHIWKDRTNHLGLIDNPLVSFGANISLDDDSEVDPRASIFKWEFKVDFKTVIEYSSQVLCWLRLTTLEDAGDGFSCADYWEKHILCLDVLEEAWAVEAVLGFGCSGRAIFDPLNVKIDSDDKSSELYKQAEKIVWGLLVGASFQKVTHGKGLTSEPTLGALWDLPENEGKDCGPGTFAELLRYGTVHFRQTRGSVATLETRPATKRVRKGILEP
ncbi:capsule polysaccharide biosynthesis [Favolaschia claudopus]|uniref:Capsule polysaccharide biosynthesis n=1 Tax=Favolaschia claudopus TaxID=2862362 RepID=A0AAW0DCI4_9AGAR